ncbi:MAG TPA: hypothetical protein VGI92_04405 [Gemmatimonadales bacterium]|jgi:hypothetical protein
MEDILAIIMIFGTGMVGIVAFSPIGRAIAERLRGKHAEVAPSEEIDELRSHLQSKQEQLSELAERQDFAERLLAQQREKTALPPAPAKDPS